MNDDEKARALATQVIGSSRRRVLCGTLAGVLGVSAASVLSACGSGGDTDGYSDDPAPDDEPAEDENNAEHEGEELAKLDDIEVGSGIVTGGLVIVRLEEEEVKAYNSACTHKGTEVGEPDGDGIMTCPNHGSQFSMTDGDVVNGPAETPLEEVAVEVHEGAIMRA